MQDIISCVLLRVSPSRGTLSVSHSALFRVFWFRLFCFVLLCRVIFLLWWHNITLGWFYHPEGGGLNEGAGFIAHKGWLYPLEGVVISPIKGGIKPPGVVLRVVLSPIGGWFYARGQKWCFVCP